MDAFVARIQDCRWLLVPLAAAIPDPPDGRRRGYPLDGRPLDSEDSHPRIGWYRLDVYRWCILDPDEPHVPGPVPARVKRHGLDVCGVVEVSDDIVRKREHDLAGVFLVAMPSSGGTNRSARFRMAHGEDHGHVRLGRRPYGGRAVFIDFETGGTHIRIVDWDEPGPEVIKLDVPLEPGVRVPLSHVDGDLLIEPFAEREVRI